MNAPAALALILLAALASGGGCSETSAADEADAGRLLADVQAKGYQSFQRAPGWPMRQRGASSHHGQFVDIYVNDVLKAAIDGGGMAPWPVGSVIIKDGWSDAAGTQPFQIAILRKDAAAAWFGAEYSAQGKVLEAGNNFEECGSCHDNGRDYVLAF